MRVNSRGKLVTCIKAITIKIKDKATEKCTGTTVLFIKVAGKKV